MKVLFHRCDICGVETYTTVEYLDRNPEASCRWKEELDLLHAKCRGESILVYRCEVCGDETHCDPYYFYRNPNGYDLWVEACHKRHAACRGEEDPDMIEYA